MLETAFSRNGKTKEGRSVLVGDTSKGDITATANATAGTGTPTEPNAGAVSGSWRGTSPLWVPVPTTTTIFGVPGTTDAIPCDASTGTTTTTCEGKGGEEDPEILAIAKEIKTEMHRAPEGVENVKRSMKAVRACFGMFDKGKDPYPDSRL